MVNGNSLYRLRTRFVKVNVKPEQWIALLSAFKTVAEEDIGLKPVAMTIDYVPPSDAPGHYSIAIKGELDELPDKETLKSALEKLREAVRAVGLKEMTVQTLRLERYDTEQDKWVQVY